MPKNKWVRSQTCRIAVAIWNFDAQLPHHLPLSIGDLVCVVEECRGWYRGYLYLSPLKLGIFPLTFVSKQDHDIVPAGQEDYPVPKTDPVAREAAECLHHWKIKLFELYAAGNRQKYTQVLNYMEDVFHWRWTLTHSNVTHDNLLNMRTKVTAKIDQINSMCSLPLTPRNAQGIPVDPSNTSVQDLHTTHKVRQDEVTRRVPQTGWDQKKIKEPTASKAYHLYLVVRNIDHHFPEDCEVFFFLFDSESKKRVSENFLINVQKSSSSPGPTRHYCIFSDLGEKEMNYCSLYLVCQVVRKGKMLLDDKKHVSNYPFRRPYAVGVLDMRQAVLEATSEKTDGDDDDYQMTYIMSLHVCASHEADFSNLHMSLIKKSGVKASDKKSISVSTAVKIIKGDLQKLRKDLAYMINKSTVTVDKLGFPDVIFPDDVRNDIYVTLEHGQFEKGNKTAPRNVEVAIAICDVGGKIIPQCIIPAAGAKPLSEYESFIYYHLNQPRWHETFKLSIPQDSIGVAHLRVGFRHVSKNEGKNKMDKTFAFSYMKLMKDNGSIIPDGTHELFVYKAEGKKWLDPNFYMKVQSAREMGGKLPSLKEKTSTRGKLSTINVEGAQFPGNQSISYSGRETVYISTLTCSTVLTQKVELVALLNWKNAFPKTRELPFILNNVKYVDGEEIVKFLPDILNCLFDILAEDPRTYGEPVFNALMSVFGIFSEVRFKHFIPVLDIYIENHFHAIATHKDLLKFLNRLIQSTDSNIDRQQDLLTVLHSLKFLMKFIIQSYILENSNYDDFRRILHEFYNSMCHLLSTQESYCRGLHTVQIELLHSLPAVLNDIAKMHNATRLAQILAQVLDSIQNIHPSISSEKMTFINAMLESDVNVLHAPDARKALLPNIMSHLISYLDNKMVGTQYRSDDTGNIGCLKAIGKVLKVMHSSESMNVDFADIEFVTKMFPNLIKLCKELLSGTNPLKADALISMIGLLRIMSDKHYSKYFNILRLNSDKPGHESDLRDAIIDLLNTINLIIWNPTFPGDWIVLHHVQNSTLLRTLKNISLSLFSCFFDDRSFIPSIWDTFFEVCVHFSTQPCLQLEQFPDLVKANLLREFGDVRSQMCKYIVELWHKLDMKKGNFIPNMIGPFLKLSLLKEKDIRLTAIPVVFDIMKYELETNGNFKRIEMEVFDKMDNFVSQGEGDEAYRDLFCDILLPLCKDIGEGASVFIDSVSHLIGLLLDYRNVQGDSSCQGQRMGCMFNLLNFYKEIEKEELYIRYVYKLSELHERDSNFTEAALTLLLHAQTLEWTNREELPGEGRYPTQTVYQRKEQLYLKATQLLDQGKNWEVGIPLCKELAGVYESQVFDYRKLSDVLRTQADFFLKIITELRVEDEYFMVGYYGKGSPLFLRNKAFIHRGQPYEKLQTFIKRQTDEFPSAKILMTADPPDNDMRNSNGLFLQVRKVIPIPEEHLVPSSEDVPISDKILEYYKTNKVSKFRYDRPFHKGKKDPDCEFATLFIERTTFVTESSFPGVINAFEVTDTTLDEMNPLDMAIETVSSKIKEIHRVTVDIAGNPALNINPLSMLLKGVIDAAVMGGISNFEKIFFQSKYIEEHPDHQKQVEELRQLIRNQVEVLREALTLHCQRVSKELMAFHIDLEERFEGFQDIVFPDRVKSSKSRSMSISRPLPPTPLAESEPKRPTRRGTGFKTNSIEVPKDGKLKRSHTTRQRSLAGSLADNRLSIVSEANIDLPPPPIEEQKRLSVISSQRQSMISTSDSDDRGNYEVIDFEDKKPVMSGTSAPPPSYAPPPVPQKQKHPESKEGYHKYIEIDFEDDFDYQRVVPGQPIVTDRPSSEHSTEFADPKEFIRSKREKSPSDSFASPPRRSSFIDKIRSRSNSSQSSQTSLPLPPQPSSPPPSPPGTSHLAPMSFGRTKMSPSPSHSASTSDSEPICEDLSSIRKRLLQQARDSLVEDTNPPSYDSTKSLIDFGDTANTPPKPQPRGSVNTPPVLPAKTLPTTQEQLEPDDYFDHLQVKNALKDNPIMRSQYEESCNMTGTYSLASDWHSDAPMLPVNISDVNSSYAMVSEMQDRQTDNRYRGNVQTPSRPAPYKSPSHSPSKSPPTSNEPPPLPRKRGTIRANTTGQYTDVPSTPPIAKQRPFSSLEKMASKHTGQAPQVFRKPYSSMSEADSPSRPSPVPPLPPKPSKPDTPSKPSAPFLPPKPSRPPKAVDPVAPNAPPSIPPRPSKPPVPNRP